MAWKLHLACRSDIPSIPAHRRSTHIWARGRRRRSSRTSTTQKAIKSPEYYCRQFMLSAWENEAHLSIAALAQAQLELFALA